MEFDGAEESTIPQLTSHTADGHPVAKGQLSACASVVRSHEGSTLVFKDVRVVLNKKDILGNVSGMASVGEIVAIMGPSGAGKSTLLNTLAGRVQVKSGSITLNGHPVNRKIRRKVSYVLQQDVFFDNLTLRETLTFTALLRLPDRMPYDLKIRRMEEIVEALELNKCFDTKIGGTLVTGLSGGEKKRASIASELITNPSLLLLDEPTSGLDSAIAYSMMSTLSKYSRRCFKTILTTIHQPSSQIFHMFSRVLLLTDGQVAYFGPGNKIIEYFSRLGLHCDPLYNPADFILEQVKADKDTVQRIMQGAAELRRQDDWPKELRDTELEPTVHQESHGEPSQASFDMMEVVTSVVESNGHNHEAVCDRSTGNLGKTNYAFTDKSVTVDGFEMSDLERSPVTPTRQEVDVDLYIDDDAKWQTGFFQQYVVLTKRAYIQSKDRYFSALNLCRFVIALFIGLEWFQLERTEATMNDRLGILFFVIVNQGFTTIMDSIFRIFDDDGVFHRERSSGIYRLSAYYLSIMTAEFPFPFIVTTIYVSIIYWMTALTPEGSNFIAFWLILELSVFVSQSYGFLMGVLITNKSFVVPISNMLLIAFLLLGGFYNSHVTDWFIWIRYISYITYSLSALVKVEYMYGHDFACNPPDRTVYPESCINGTTIKGIQFVDQKNLNFSPIYADVLVLVGLLIVLRVATYIILRCFRRPKT